MDFFLLHKQRSWKYPFMGMQSLLKTRFEATTECAVGPFRFYTWLKIRQDTSNIFICLATSFSLQKKFVLSHTWAPGCFFFSVFFPNASDASHTPLAALCSLLPLSLCVHGAPTLRSGSSMLAELLKRDLCGFHNCVAFCLFFIQCFSFTLHSPCSELLCLSLPHFSPTHILQGIFLQQTWCFGEKGSTWAIPLSSPSLRTEGKALNL